MAAVALLSSPLAGQAAVEWSAPERVLTVADTFAFRVNGQQFGTQVVKLVRADDGFRFEETTTMPMGGQTSVVLMTPQLGMRAVEQRGLISGQEMRIDVAYAADRATGSALTPTTGNAPTAIDAVIPAGVIDDNVMVALLPAIDWRSDTDVVLPVFHSGQGSVAQVRLRVTGTETVDTPAGLYETYRIETSGDRTQLVFFVETAASHRVVRFEIVGTPMEVVRING